MLFLRRPLSAGQFLLEQSRLSEAAEMAERAAELDQSEFDVVFSAAHMLRLAKLLTYKNTLCKWSFPTWKKSTQYRKSNDRVCQEMLRFFNSCFYRLCGLILNHCHLIGILEI